MTRPPASHPGQDARTRWHRQPRAKTDPDRNVPDRRAVSQHDDLFAPDQLATPVATPAE